MKHKLCFAFIGILFIFLLPLDAFKTLKASKKPTKNVELFFNSQKNNESSRQSDGIFSRVLRSIPWFRSKEQLSTPQPDSSQRYHLRLRRPLTRDRRHVTTRLTRFFPDLTFETAQSIVDAAIESDNGISLIRVFNSIKDVKYYYDMLRLADPPVIAEIYDTRTNDIVIL
jgi:hypothetical protein